MICASTGNTAASAAAYAARAGLTGAVIVPEGKIATGKLAQALMHGARVIALRGNFDQALALVRELVQRHPIALVNSVNPFRLEGQKTAALEIAEELGPIDALAIPVGNAGNITAYWKGFQEVDERPMMLGFQAEGAAPLVHGEPVANPETVASAIRIGNPARWEEAMAAMTASHGAVRAVSDAQILDAYRFLAAHEGVFCEPASATSVAGVLVARRDGRRAGGLRAHRPRPEGPAGGARARRLGGAVRARPAGGRIGRHGLSVGRGVRVRVPASSANLGPGFDVLAAALGLHMELEVEETGRFEVRTDLAIARDRRNLCVRGFAALREPDGIRFTIRSDIPLSGGLGTSAAAYVAGLAAADALNGGGADLLAEAARLEGHPDNAAAALLGGFVVCADGGATRARPAGRAGGRAGRPGAGAAHGAGAGGAAAGRADGRRGVQRRPREPARARPRAGRSRPRRARPRRPPAPAAPRVAVSAVDGAGRARPLARRAGRDDLRRRAVGARVGAVGGRRRRRAARPRRPAGPGAAAAVRGRRRRGR